VVKRNIDEENNESVPVMLGRRPDPDPTLRTMQLVDKAIASLRAELDTRFHAVENRFDGIDLATKLVHEDYVRVPTVVDKAIGGLRELMEARIDSLERLLEILRESIEIRPEAVASAVKHLENLMDQKIATCAERLDGKIQHHVGQTDERFAGVGAQFAERDTRTDQRAGDTKLAVDAAFAAAKEATSKIEAGFTKQIDSMVGVIDTLAKNVDSKISDVKDTVGDLKIRTQSVESRAAVIDPSIRNDLTGVMAEVRTLAGMQKMAEGSKVKSDDSWKMILAIGGLAIAALGVFLKYGGAG
jgi:type VI protein secretion system component VasK